MDLRKIDELVAEHVMGHKPWGLHGGLFNYFSMPEPARPYSSDISAAWEVVWHLGGSHKFWLQSEHGLWNCSFDGGPEVHDVEMPELAICLAALKARGITTE